MRVYPTVNGEAMGIAAVVEADRDDAEDRLRNLFDAHHARLYRLARRLMRTPDEARDLVQDTYVRIARAPGSVPVGATSEEAWLVRVMVNICRDGWRRRAAHQRLDEQHLQDMHPRAASSPEAALVARNVVWSALQRLTPRRRAALILYELEGTGITEIARMLGVSAVTVRWHLSQGRRDMARIIGSPQKGPS